MKPAERPVLRETNKSPFIKFPIKETVTTTAHKISLMIQIQLGGVELPTEKGFNIVRRQFGIDKSIIFERIQRLIRCVIDCKSFDRDAVATRHALELARSLSAEFWENSNLQLRQIPGIGPAAVRKLVGNNVNSVEKLAGLDTASVERAVTKNPPYGRKLLDSIAGFPLLKLVLEITSRAPTIPGKKPEVKIRAVLSYHNKRLPVWKNRKPSLTFIAETTDGTLVHIWRGNIMKLEKGFELKFPAELSGPDEEIRCWIACDDIVGTSKSCVLKPNLPATAFPPPVSPEETPQKEGSSSGSAAKKQTFDDSDEFGEDELDDDDLVAAVKGAEKKAESDYGSDRWVDVDDVEEIPQSTKSRKKKKTESVVPESVRMANGKWTCNHVCTNGQLLKNGKPCRHLCCREGLDRPAKSKRKV